MSALPNLIYILNAILTKILANNFVDSDKTDSKVYIVRQKTQNSQFNTEEQRTNSI
jgi:hypothetical protein